MRGVKRFGFRGGTLQDADGLSHSTGTGSLLVGRHENLLSHVFQHHSISRVNAGEVGFLCEHRFQAQRLDR